MSVKEGRGSLLIQTYLLESSCVCQLSDPERNYHCFYLLCVALAKVKYSFFILKCSLISITKIGSYMKLLIYSYSIIMTLYFIGKREV